MTISAPAEKGKTMREYFDIAYEHFCDGLRSIEVFVGLMFGCLVYLTLPIWVIPYLIIKRCRRKDNDNQQKT